MSTTSTPGETEFKPLDLPTGLQTPQSMSDVSENLELADDEQDMETRVNKRKGKSPSSFPSLRCVVMLTSGEAQPVTPDSDAVFSDASTSASGSRPRYKLSVELPSSRKRSKLATEKTTSLDNLTLGSPADKKPERSSSGLMMSDTIEEVRLSAV